MIEEVIGEKIEEIDEDVEEIDEQGEDIHRKVENNIQATEQGGLLLHSGKRARLQYIESNF